MLDPFPIRAPSQITTLTQRLAYSYGLFTLSYHIHEIILSALVYHLICVFVSPYISTRLFPRTYPSLPWRTRINWDVHFVSLIQSIMINCVGLYVLLCDQERNSMDWRERVWGYTGALGMVEALATGYFAWDLYMSASHIDVFGYGLLAHAVSALIVYVFGFRPFVNYYGPVFILYELSSPFLNFHWFLDKLDMTGSDPQLYNGILLMTSFFSSRLVWGIYNSYHILLDVLRALQYQDSAAGQLWLQNMATNATFRKDYLEESLIGRTPEIVRATLEQKSNLIPKPIPYWLAGIYLGSNLVLTLLNVVWFNKMIETIRARFDPPFGTRKPEVVQKEVSLGRAADTKGKNSIEVKSKEVRRRKA